MNNEKPILFSAPMVRAILEGRKTQTRRIVNPSKVLDAGQKRIGFEFSMVDAVAGDLAWIAAIGAASTKSKLKAMKELHREQQLNVPVRHPADDKDEPWSECPRNRVYSPYTVGMRLWVKETWSCMEKEPTAGCEVAYRADLNGGSSQVWEPWKPSLFMPRWASRITLEVTEVRVQRLNDIPAEDCIAEGIDYESHKCGCEPCAMTSTICPASASSLIEAYRSLWESINGLGSWEKNSWVWCITFKRIQ